MNTKFLLGMALIAMMVSGCKPSKQTVAGMGNTEVIDPCEDYYKDSKEYFVGEGIAENTNMQSARIAALMAAKNEVMQKVGGMARGLVNNYNKTMTGSAAQTSVGNINESSIITEVERMMNDAEVTCNKLYQTPAGTYKSYITVRVSKEEIANNVATKLGDEEKLKMEYDRENFRKFAKDYMNGLNEQNEQ